LAAESDPEGRLLMSHPGVGPVDSLAYVRILADRRRFPRGKQGNTRLGRLLVEAAAKVSAAM
jgi:transposase